MGRKILVAVDGSQPSYRAIDIAAEIAEENDDVLLFTVVGRGDLPESVKQYARVEHIDGPPDWQYEQLVASGVLDAAKEHAKDKGIQRIQTSVRTGDPAQSIIDMATENAVAMIVMGNRGLGALKGLAFGSVSQKVNHAAQCAVVTVK